MGASKPASRTAKNGRTQSQGQSQTYAHARANVHARPTLEPRIKHIPQATIRKKWKPLPQSSQDKIHSILLNLRTKRAGSGGGPNARIPRVSKPSARKSTRTGAPRAASESKTAIAEAEYATVVEDMASRHVPNSPSLIPRTFPSRIPWRRSRSPRSPLTFVPHRLLSRLPRMPFPPTSSSSNRNGNSNSNSHAADDFDLSGTLARISTLQAQLTGNMQSARLLSRQINRENAALKLDKKELKTLEDGLRGSRELRRRKERGLHPLALARSHQDGHKDEEMARENAAILGIKIAAGTLDVGSLCLTTAPTATTDSTQSTESTDSALGAPPTADPVDREMNTLLGQLRNHLQSMRDNTASMLPVVDAVEEAKVALEKFAARNLDEAALGQLYGGAVV
ncbi:hypothetical protein A1O7_06899 [Cladophialophora yegresii CBS 114405]|uniref:Uncharacterized protein n=1 Tax=Cladophialophora yegresii CBS 114405 TaxID=1182544 RepID=W9VU50_9EURO|nr:uncharacterized protein A1O7_06899 [Cladophialophora yegresii CBS 114405]EXJ56555.1 hypothetical protein A1O7_06899 [Cladophialophora yegresii CBS 114405]